LSCVIRAMIAMPFLKTIVVMTLLGACVQPGSPQHERIMDTIERQVQLPVGARPLADYARYYATDPSGRVIAIYTTFSAPTMEDHNLPVGQRRWVEEYGHLPNMVGGGCDTVNIVYYPATGGFELPACNGGSQLPPA